jgi:class 3 adenylate cyclase
MAPTPARAPGRLKSSLLSLRLSLGGAFVSIVVLTALLLGAALFPEVHKFIRDDMRAQLRSAVGVAALEIDSRQHERITSKADEDSAEYLGIRKQLQAFHDRTRHVRYIYTLRKNDLGQIIFVVDAEQDPALKSHVGDVYPKPTPEMLAAFDKPYGPHVEKEFVTDQWGRFISGYAPLVGPDGKAFGVLGMDLAAGDEAAFEDHFLRLALAIFLGVALAVALISFALTKRLSRPLTDLALDMSHIQNFDLDSDIEIHSRIKEITEMKTSLDNMKKGLRSFKRYVPADLVSELIKLGQEATLGAENRPVTALFSDIEGFTTISESLPPERLSECLGVYFEGMTRAILDEGGTVDKFIGDAIMAFWGAPHPVEDHAARACRAALRCQEFIAQRFGRDRRDGEPAFRTRMGINTGEAYVGNFGYRDRLSYTAIGDPINLASRLEAMNKHYGTRLMVSESTLAAAGAEFMARPIDRVAVKGKKQGVLVYELATDPQSKDFLTRFAAAFQLYEGRQWAKAAESFGALAEMRPDDGPAKILLERCRGFAAAPPAQWNGVFALTEK